MLEDDALIAVESGGHSFEEATSGAATGSDLPREDVHVSLGVTAHGEAHHPDVFKMNLKTELHHSQLHSCSRYASPPRH